MFILGLCVFSGLAQLVAGTRSSSLQELLPDWLTASWAVLLVVGAVTTLTGVFWRKRTTGLLLEMAGRVCFAPAALIYAAALIVVAGPPGLLASAPFIGFAASSLWRVHQVHRDIRDVRDVLATMTWAAEQDES